MTHQSTRKDAYFAVNGNSDKIGFDKGRSSSSVGLYAFKLSLQTLAQDIGTIDRDIQRHIQATRTRLVDDRVSLTIGGHFSSGKSTLINAALARPLLPTSDYPDTGAICVLRAGEQDSAEILYDGQRRQTIACTTDALSEQISLRLPTGMENTAVYPVEAVNITLANSPIPAKTYWIDSPGIDESEGMLERASNAARQSDILLWVLDSRQYLSLVEQEFIKDHVAERGPASVVFIINVFLENDTLPEWNNYMTNSFPTHRNKMKSVATSMGFTQTTPPEVIVVSARALCRYKGDLFGGSSLQALLQALNTPGHPRIHQARLFQTANVLQEIATSISANLIQEQEKVRQAQEIFEQTRQQAENHKKKFVEEVEAALNRFLAEWRTSAHLSERDLILTINSSTLQRDDTYSHTLSDALKKSAAEGIEILLNRVTTAIKHYEQKNLTSADIATLRQMLMPPNAVVNVPNTTPKAIKGAATIAAGAAAGGIVPGIGHLVGALAGAAAAGVAAYASHHAAVQKDVAATQSNLTSATQSVITAVEGKRYSVRSFILQCCMSKKIIASPSTTYLHYLEQQLTSISQLREQARLLAKEG